MAAPTVAALPTTPSRTRPADFPTEADAFFAAFPTLRTEINAFVAYLNSTALVSYAFGAGTVAAPSIHNDGDTDTGWYWPSANVLAAATAGVKRLEIGATGNVGIGVSPSYPLHVQSSVNIHTKYSLADHATFSNTIDLVDVGRAGASGFNFGLWRSNTATTPDNEFKFRGDGNGSCDGSWTGGGADYAEWQEWLDGNPENEDRVGLSVVFDSGKIRKAIAGEAPFGVVSGNPSIVGDGDSDRWKQKYLSDEFGRYIWEDYSIVQWNVVTPAVIEENVLIAEESTEVIWYASDSIPAGIDVPENAETLTVDSEGKALTRRKLNPDFDPTVEYRTRAERAEWCTVGSHGKLRIRKGQPINKAWVFKEEISKEVDEYYIAGYSK